MEIIPLEIFLLIQPLLTNLIKQNLVQFCLHKLEFSIQAQSSVFLTAKAELTEDLKNKALFIYMHCNTNDLLFSFRMVSEFESITTKCFIYRNKKFTDLPHRRFGSLLTRTTTNILLSELLLKRNLCGIQVPLDACFLSLPFHLTRIVCAQSSA